VPFGKGSRMERPASGSVSFVTAVCVNQVMYAFLTKPIAIVSALLDKMKIGDAIITLEQVLSKWSK
jgi:hypothetical protein